MQIVHAPAADQDVALGHRVQPGDHVEQRRLAAARGPDQHQKFAGLDRDVDAFEDLGRRRSAS